MWELIKSRFRPLTVVEKIQAEVNSIAYRLREAEAESEYMKSVVAPLMYQLRRAEASLAMAQADQNDQHL